jgi:hypothetical protein
VLPQFTVNADTTVHTRAAAATSRLTMVTPRRATPDQRPPDRRPADRLRGPAAGLAARPGDPLPV